LEILFRLFLCSKEDLFILNNSKSNIFIPVLQNTFESVAMKVMRREPDGKGFNSEASITREIAILKSVQHVRYTKI